MNHTTTPKWMKLLYPGRKASWAVARVLTKQVLFNYKGAVHNREASFMQSQAAAEAAEYWAASGHPWRAAVMRKVAIRWAR